jgi:hypothetical protein
MRVNETAELARVLDTKVSLLIQGVRAEDESAVRDLLMSAAGAIDPAVARVVPLRRLAQ